MRSASTAARLSAVLFAVLLAPCSMLLAQSYEIRLERPEKVGQKSRIVVSARRSLTVTATEGEKVTLVKSERLFVEADGVQIALEVNAKGATTNLSIQFDKLDKLEGTLRTALLPKGSTVTASSTGNKVTFELDGKPVSTELRDALALLHLLPRRPDAANDDDVFGTSERKKVGDSWPINAERCAQDFWDAGLPVAKENFTGTVTLDRLAKVGELDCLQVSVNFAEKGIAPTNLPADAQVIKSEEKAVMTGKFPVDVTLPCPEYSLEADATMVVRGKQRANGTAAITERKLEEGKTLKRFEVK